MRMGSSIDTVYRAAFDDLYMFSFSFSSRRVPVIQRLIVQNVQVSGLFPSLGASVHESKLSTFGPTGNYGIHGAFQPKVKYPEYYIIDH